MSGENTNSTQNPIIAFFRSFLIQIQKDNGQKPEEILPRVAEVFKQEHKEKLNPLDIKNHQLHEEDDDLIEIFIVQELQVAEAWDWNYILGRLEDVIFVEPQFDLLSPAATPLKNMAPSKSLYQSSQGKSQNPEWSLYEMRVCQNPQETDSEKQKNAWDLFPDGKEPGEGVTIGHPDSGYLLHPELGQPLNLEIYQALIGGNLDKNELKSHDNIPSIFWHGLSTASLIVSPKNRQLHGSKDKTLDVTGVAPAAKLKPFPIKSYPIYQPNSEQPLYKIYTSELAKAIDEAVKQDVDILSISLGGDPNLLVRRAIIRAQRKGIIVIAAAGNLIPFAVWPSAYDNVISVGSSTPNGTLADHSSKGGRVDVAAPGDLIWCATAEKINGRLNYGIQQTCGSSYATALVAGVAALWLSYHGGRHKLAEIYGYSRVPLVFNQLLRQSCFQPPGWDKNNWGVGIVDAYELLKAKLPELDDPYIQEPLAYREVDHVRLDRGGVETFIHIFEQTLSDSTFLEGISVQILGDSILKKLIFKLDNSNKSALAQEIRSDAFQWVISKFLGVSGKDLRQFLRTFGREIIFYLGTDFTLYQRMENAFKHAAGLPIDDSGDDLSSVVQALKNFSSQYLSKHLK